MSEQPMEPEVPEQQPVEPNPPEEGERYDGGEIPRVDPPPEQEN